MDRPTSIRFQGRDYPVMDRWIIGGCEFLILRRLSGRSLSRYLAFDRRAGPDGDLRVIHVLSKSRRSTQQLMVLRSASKTIRTFTKLLRFQAEGETIRVVTEWVPGDDLESYLERAHAGAIPWPSPVEAFRLFHGLAYGLKQWHRSVNAVHGDIKPANLILSPRPRQLVLIDYGSAWPVERTATRDQGDGHSPGYAAPERIVAGALNDFRSDQFSATVVFYELLTGELPFGGHGGDAAHSPQRDKLSAAYLPPSQIAREQRFIPAGVWQQIDAIVVRGLAWNPDRRFVSSSEWLAALKQLDAAMTLAEAPETPFQRRLLGVLDWVDQFRTRTKSGQDHS